MNKGLILGLAVCAVVLGALTAACGGDGATDATLSASDRGGTNSETAPSFATPGPNVAKDVASGAPASGAALPQSGGTAAPADLPSQLDRKIISNTSLTLAVGDVGAVFNDAQQIARTNGGYTEKSSYSNATNVDTKQRAATLTLRVPATNLDAAMNALRGIQGAKVTNEGAKSTEITDQYTDLQSRLRNLERTEQSYLALLAQAKTIQDIITVNDRLDSVRGQIEQIQGRLNVYDNMANLATIDVTIVPAVPANANANEGGPKGFRASFEDAWDWSTERAQYLISGAGAAGAVAIWLALPLALVLVAARFARRHGGPGNTSPAGE